MLDEYKGHCLLEGARQADSARVKKHLSVEVINFKHPYTGDSALVSQGLIYKDTSLLMPQLRYPAYPFSLFPAFLPVLRQGCMQDKIIASYTCFGGHMDVNY